MKVVLFCGGFGMRLREYSESIPKPMVNIGYRPILWHVMKYYAHYGHKDFILCLGWKANVIKEFFLNYNECVSNDFVMTAGGQGVRLLNRDIDDWNITFVDTGTTANIGQRLKAVQPYLQNEDMFLANYTDGLSDVNLDQLVAFHQSRKAVATFLSVPPSQSFHVVQSTSEGSVSRIEPASTMNLWINGGFFVFTPQIFDYLKDGEELVEEPFQRLIAEQRLATLRYQGFWSCMDTYKEVQTLLDMYGREESPWTVWRNAEHRNPGGTPAKRADQANPPANAGDPELLTGMDLPVLSAGRPR